jgi:5-methylcytosine-specific restriction enzyme A
MESQARRGRPALASMKQVSRVLYRYLTHADFHHTNKPPKTEARGGGQSYFDSSTQDVTVAQWEELLGNAEGTQRFEAKRGPRWKISVWSVGTQQTYGQSATVYQRRSTSVIIASQKLGTAKSNRIHAWHPDFGFPRPAASDPTKCPLGLAIVLLKTTDREIWASWFLNDGVSHNPFATIARVPGIASMLATPKYGSGGIFETEGLCFEPRQLPFAMTTTDAAQAMSASRATPLSEDRDIEAMLDRDSVDARDVSYSIRTVRRRNRRAVERLKSLYDHRCQVSREQFLFLKRDGKTYHTEVHHLIPLGAGGADSPENMVVVSPHIHAMLHHARVDGIDLTKLQRRADGSASLPIRINGSFFEIVWKAQHAGIIEDTDSLASEPEQGTA